MSGRLRPQTARTALRDDDADSIASFQSSPSPTKPSSKLQTWTGSQQVDLGCCLQHSVRSITRACCMAGAVLLLCKSSKSRPELLCRLTMTPTTKCWRSIVLQSKSSRAMSSRSGSECSLSCWVETQQLKQHKHHQVLDPCSAGCHWIAAIARNSCRGCLAVTAHSSRSCSRTLQLCEARCHCHVCT